MFQQVGPHLASPDCAPATPRKFRVEIFDGTDLTGAAWPSIAAAPELLMHVYQSREFLEVWMATVGKARRTRGFLVVVRDGYNRPVLYLPLAIETRFNNRILRFMDGGVVDFNAPILHSSTTLTHDEFAAIWDDICARLPTFDLIDLQKIAADICGAPNPFTYLDCGPYRSSGHALALSARTEQVTSSVGRMRKKLKRQRQRLAAIGPIRIVNGSSASHLPSMVDRLIALKRQQYLRTTGRDFFTSPGVLEFYLRMTTPELLGRISDLSALFCGDEVASVHLGFRARGRFYYVLPAFDTRYRPFAVGLLLLDHLVERCAEVGYAIFDLGEGDSAYKSKWSTHSVQLLSREQAMNPLGALFGQIRRVRRLTSVDHFYNLCTGGLKGPALAKAHDQQPVRAD